MRRNLTKCPSCSGDLKISQYHCPSCGIDINGEFEGCMFCNLNDEDRYLALVFLQTGGNIRDVERVMGISYPTVKAKLAQLLAHLGVSPEENHRGATKHRFGDRLREKHAQRDELRRMKREIKNHVHRNVHRHIKGAMKAFVRMGDEENDTARKPQQEVDEDFRSEVGSALSDLKEGKIDVASVLKRLRGEEEKVGIDEDTKVNDEQEVEGKEIGDE